MQMAHRIGPLLEYETKEGARKTLELLDRALLDALADYAIDPDGITAATADAGKVKGNPEKTKFSVGRADKKTGTRPPAQIARPARDTVARYLYGYDLTEEQVKGKVKGLSEPMKHLESSGVIQPLDDGTAHKGRSRQYRLWVAEFYYQYASKKRAEEEAQREVKRSNIEAGPTPKFVLRAPKQAAGTDMAQETEAQRDA